MLLCTRDFFLNRILILRWSLMIVFLLTHMYMYVRTCTYMCRHAMKKTINCVQREYQNIFIKESILSYVSCLVFICDYVWRTTNYVQ